MDQSSSSLTNFAHLQIFDEQLVRLGMLAEKYTVDDPNTCLLKMRQFAELLAQHVAAQMGLYKTEGESQYELLRRLLDEDILSREIYHLFGEIRRVGNAASHEILSDHQLAINTIKIGWQLGIWFKRTFKDAEFNPGEFISPKDDIIVRDHLLEEVEQAQRTVEKHLVDQQSASARKRSQTIKNYRSAAQVASRNLQLDEAATRQLIDQQLCQVGWQADSAHLRYGKGVRPEPVRTAPGFRPGYALIYPALNASRVTLY